MSNEKWIEEIYQAQKEVCDIELEYGKVIDQIAKIEADLFLSGNLTGKTLKEKEAEILQHTYELHEKKRNLRYQFGLAKARVKRLERLYESKVKTEPETI
ncbi:hypothetical protein NYE37_13870 [Thermoactinomyces sp. FSL K6-2592]|jgi:hypothetical protein|uniref:hypothetical protein n=1 Tax=Thermoactinomyces sp. FSL K6-2592 TaxID=2975347 RepID=UPI0030FA3B53